MNVYSNNLIKKKKPRQGLAQSGAMRAEKRMFVVCCLGDSNCKSGQSHASVIVNSEDFGLQVELIATRTSCTTCFVNLKLKKKI